MMIPITRKEKYINEIVGGGDTAPETPQTREEFFFADILGEVIAPSPVTRVEKYLSAIAGQYSGDLPTPTTRTEYFLAKAAGMEIETPIPITREEMLWDTYILIKTIEGIPPLTFKAKKAGTLENYRIYGNTVDGESVGDRTGNLFDGEIEQGGLQGTDGTAVNSPRRVRSTGIQLSGGDYTISATGCDNIILLVYSTAADYISRESKTSFQDLPFSFSLEDDRIVKFAFKKIDNSFLMPLDISNVMLNEGSTPLPYEPYGYRVPVTVSNGTDAQTIPIYLSEQIRKVGDEAEYIDYAEQKQYFADGTETDVTLPALPTLPGTNVLSVGTAVQPSKVYVKYKGERQ